MGRSLLAHHRSSGWVASYDPCTRKWRAHEPVRREMVRADVLVVDDTHVAFCCGPPDRSGLMYDVGRTKPATIAPVPSTPNPGRRRRALDHGFLTPTDKRFDSRTGRWTIIPFDDAIREAVGRQDSAIGNGAHWVLTWGGRGTDPSTGTVQLYPGGALFDGSSNTWRLVSTTGSPGPRFGGVTVWTGSEMFVYGGQGQLADGRFVPRNDGGRYDPSADRWTAIAPGPVFEGPIAGTVAGRTVLVWDAVRGGAFDLDRGRWREFGLPAKVPVQSRPFGHGRLAVVTREEAFVLDPETLRWGRSTLPSALQGRNQRVDVMTSSHLVVWGGERIVSTGGCEDAPPDVGCDPFTETKVALDGAALAVGSCR